MPLQPSQSVNTTELSMAESCVTSAIMQVKDPQLHCMGAGYCLLDTESVCRQTSYGRLKNIWITDKEKLGGHHLKEGNTKLGTFFLFDIL